MKQKLLDLLLTVRSYFPTKLPVGMTAFETWSEDIIKLTGPIADKNSLKFAIASQIMHSDASRDSVPMQFFVKRLRKAAANQIAAQVFQDIKTAQQEAAKTQAPADTANETTKDVTEVLQNKEV